MTASWVTTDANRFSGAYNNGEGASYGRIFSAYRTFLPKELGDKLWIAAASGQNNIVKIFLDRGADINYTVHRSTPLDAALQNKYNDTARLLIARGADVSLVLKDNRPLLDQL